MMMMKMSIDGEREAATRDRIISCSWQPPLWMKVFFLDLYDEEEDDGDDGYGGEVDDEDDDDNH